MDPALLQKLQTAIVHNNASRFVSVAGWTVLVWDHLLTFANEVKYIWPAPLSTVKFLFLFNRYMTLMCLSVTIYEMAGLTVYPSRVIWAVAGGIIEVVCAGIARVLLLLRVYALWERRRWVLWFLSILFLVANTFIVVCTLISIFQSWEGFYWFPITRSCAINKVPPLLYGVWVPPVFVETVIFVMTMIKAVQHWRAEQLQTPLLQSLYRDSILFFFVIIVLRIFALIVWAALPPTLLALGLNFFWGLNTAMVSRILMSLRNVGSADDWARATAVLSDDNRQVTAMQFADRGHTTLGYTTQWTTRRSGGDSCWTEGLGDDEDEVYAMVKVKKDEESQQDTQDSAATPMKGKEVDVV